VPSLQAPAQSCVVAVDGCGECVTVRIVAGVVESAAVVVVVVVGGGAVVVTAVFGGVVAVVGGRIG